MKNGGVPDIRVVDNYTETQPQQARQRTQPPHLARALQRDLLSMLFRVPYLTSCAACMQIHLGLASTQVGNLAYWVMWATGHNKVTPITGPRVINFAGMSAFYSRPAVQLSCLFKPVLSCRLQTGTGQLTPNNPNSVATIVQYGLKPDHLDLTAIGAAEVNLHNSCRHCMHAKRLGVLHADRQHFPHARQCM